MVVTFIIAVVVGIIAKLAADEVKAWCPWLVNRLITFAASRLSNAERARFAEEWLSHANEMPGDIAKVLHALGTVAAAYKITSFGLSVKAQAKTTEGGAFDYSKFTAYVLAKKLKELPEKDQAILLAYFHLSKGRTPKKDRET